MIKKFLLILISFPLIFQSVHAKRVTVFDWCSIQLKKNNEYTFHDLIGVMYEVHKLGFTSGVNEFHRISKAVLENDLVPSLLEREEILKQISKDYELARDSNKSFRRSYDLLLKRLMPSTNNFSSLVTEFGPTLAFSKYFIEVKNYHLTTGWINEKAVRELTLFFQGILRSYNNPAHLGEPYIMIYGSIANGHATLKSDVDIGIFPDDLLFNSNSFVHNYGLVSSLGISGLELMRKVEVLGSGFTDSKMYERELLLRTLIQPFALKVTSSDVFLIYRGFDHSGYYQLDWFNH